MLESDDLGEPMVEVEFLHTLRPAGTPEHELNLKVGMPVMLLRNLDAAKGLCNGTRMLVVRVARNRRTLTCRIASGAAKFIGSLVQLPRIRFRQAGADLGFEWTRTQFPVKVAFAMTINKAQGAPPPAQQAETQ